MNYLWEFFGGGMGGGQLPHETGVVSKASRIVVLHSRCTCRAGILLPALEISRTLRLQVATCPRAHNG